MATKESIREVPVVSDSIVKKTASVTTPEEATSETKRAPASSALRKIDTDNQTGSVQEENSPMIKTVGIEKMKNIYFKSLPSYMKWEVIDQGQYRNGKQVRIELKDQLNHKATSYNALVNEKTGRILATWNRQINE